MNKLDTVIEIASEIKACRNRLRELEKSLHLLIDTSSQTEASPTATATGVTGRRGSYGRTILTIMNGDNEKVFSEEELLETAKVEEQKKPSFRSALSRLVKNKQITRIAVKQYMVTAK